jgi:hypothetical protein
MKRTASVYLLLITVPLSSFGLGCSGDSKHGSLTGTVTLDGEPLKSGLIRFIPADGRTASADATITDGKFTATVPIGEKQIWISAPKVVGKQKAYNTPDSPTVDVVEELLPAEYNVASTLKLTVTATKLQPTYDLKKHK